MHERRLLSTILAALGCLVVFSALRPDWPFGRRLDELGTRAAFAWREPVPVSPLIVLVEIDDASIDALGPWPWAPETLRKLFEGPLYLARSVVCLVSPADFRFDEGAGEALWQGLAELPTAFAAFPYASEPVALNIAKVLDETPSGGQSTVLRRTQEAPLQLMTRLPQMRAQALEGFVRRAALANEDLTLEQLLEKVLAPYWQRSGNTAALAKFLFSQVLSRRALATGAFETFLEGAAPEGTSRLDGLYLPPARFSDHALGFAGAGPELKFPYVPAVVSFEGRPVLRLGLVAADLAGDRDTPSDTEETRVRPVDSRAALIPNWTGNGHTAWNEGFERRISAAALVETANAKRAAWQVYREFEESLGLQGMGALIKRYERAAHTGSWEQMIQAERGLMARTRHLRDILAPAISASAPEDSPVAGLTEEQVDKQAYLIATADADYQILHDTLVSMLTYAERASATVMLAPTARTFRTLETPWREKVAPAALELSLLNSVLTGHSLARTGPISDLPVLAAAFLLALAAGRFGARRVAVFALVVTAGVLYYWFRLFEQRGLLAGFRAMAAVPFAFAAGSAVFRLVIGRQRDRLARALAGRVHSTLLSGAKRAGGVAVLRGLEESAVLAIAVEPPECAGTGLARTRYRRHIVENIREQGGIVFDAASEIEGAFGWLKSGNALERAAFCAFSSFRRIKLLVEKMRVEGAGTTALRTGLGCGPGELALGTVSAENIRTCGASFEKARRALAVAAKFDARVVICEEDRETVSGRHALRRLDLEGRYFEVLERTGAVPTGLLRASELYEKALDAVAAGDTGDARALLEEALRATDDGPSRALLGRLEAGTQTANGSEHEPLDW
ncbi:MAG: CHASE2 domain-containing protein [Planctomycetota bacterium]